MSAFVCDDITINRIVAGLLFASLHGGHGKSAPVPAEELSGMIGVPAEFGRTLYAMNVNAVEQRYPNCVGHPDRLPGQKTPYKFVGIIPPGGIQLYKSIQCFLYQCSEGDVPELPLYKMLHTYAIALATHLIEQSGAYQKADWG